MDRLHELEDQAQTRATHGPHVERRIPMSYEEFLTSIEDSTHAEWVNGEAIIFMPPSTRHQDIVVYLVAMINAFAKVFNLGKTLTSPFEMRISPEGNAREPDIIFVTQDNLARLTDRRLIGPADLVVEVVSASSIARDRTDKFYEYQAGGVREYWVIDPRPGVARADFWILDAAGSYRPVPIDTNGIYTSTVLPDFKLNVTALLAEEFPNPLHALAEMIGMDALLQALQRKE